jgi:transposase-like protein
VAKAKLAALANDHAGAYPYFARSLEQDLDALVCHLRFPYEHRKRTRSTNLLERTSSRSDGGRR